VVLMVLGTGTEFDFGSARDARLGLGLLWSN